MDIVLRFGDMKIRSFMFISSGSCPGPVEHEQDGYFVLSAVQTTEVNRLREVRFVGVERWICEVNSSHQIRIVGQ